MIEQTGDAILLAKIEAATIPVPTDAGLPVARFVLIVPVGRDPASTAADVEASLANFGARVTPLTSLDARALALTLPGRALRGDYSVAFEAAYALMRRFELEAAEPEIFVDVFPEADPRRQGPPQESVDDFPPGCWVPEQANLKKWWALEKIFAPQAWAFSESRQRPSRGSGIIVGQPDTGVAKHPELDGVPHVPGYNFVDNNTDTTDPLNYSGNPGHGTGTGSVLLSPESGEISGSAPRATHMPIRAIESVTRLSQVAVAEAIDFAVQHGAQIITMSLGGIPSFSLYRALSRAVEADVIVLAAAGNCVGLVVWPARYEDCIAVAGINVDDKPWRGSSSGPDVDISAPAENVFRARVELGKPPTVGQGQGTSFAVALTAGVAACWLAHHGRANLIAEARARSETLQIMFNRMLKATARRPTGWDGNSMGTGIVHAQRLIEADFDVGRDRETASLVPRSEALGLAVRRFVAEAVSPEAALAGIDWKIYGPEIALQILQAKVGRAPAVRGAVQREMPAPVPSPPLSPTLEDALAANPILAAAFKGQDRSGRSVQ
jgi:serine protease